MESTFRFGCCSVFPIIGEDLQNVKGVLPHSVIDNSDFSPNRLTVFLDSPYPFFSGNYLLPISSSEVHDDFSDILVSARGLPPPRSGAALASFFAPSSAFPFTSRQETARAAPSAQATHPA
jgi:hypothetical protein